MTQKPEGFVEQCVHGVILGVCLHCANAALRARVAELEKILPPMEQRHIGPGQGSWSVFAGQVAEERDALRQQVAALADALVGMTRSVHRCYEHNDDLGDAMDLAKAVLRATGRKT